MKHGICVSLSPPGPPFILPRCEIRENIPPYLLCISYYIVDKVQEIRRSAGPNVSVLPPKNYQLRFGPAGSQALEAHLICKEPGLKEVCCVWGGSNKEPCRESTSISSFHSATFLSGAQWKKERNGRRRMAKSATSVPGY